MFSLKRLAWPWCTDFIATFSIFILFGTARHSVQLEVISPIKHCHRRKQVEMSPSTSRIQASLVDKRFLYFMAKNYDHLYFSRKNKPRQLQQGTEKTLERCHDDKALYGSVTVSWKRCSQPNRLFTEHLRLCARVMLTNT